jgi:hypothetical protein
VNFVRWLACGCSEGCIVLAAVKDALRRATGAVAFGHP